MRYAKPKFLLSWVNPMGGGGKYFDSHAEALDYANDIGVDFRNPLNVLIMVFVDE